MRRSTMTVFASVFALTLPASASARQGSPTFKLTPLGASDIIAIPPALDIERLMRREARRIHAIRHRQAVRRRAHKRALARRRAAERLAAEQFAAPAITAGSAAASAPNSALQSIAQCESGGNPGAISPGGTYRGKYQFSQSTWQSVGGTGDPAAASEAEQDRLAAKLYRTGGPGHWPVCGR